MKSCKRFIAFSVLITMLFTIVIPLTVSADEPGSEPLLICPVPYNNAYVSSPYGQRSTPGGSGASFHYGIDITMGGASAYDKKIVAAGDGTVLVASNACGHNYPKAVSCGCNGGYGNYCVIDHGNGIIAWYAHLTTCYVSVGQEVVQGQPIGIMGSTGYSTGAHLHFEIRRSVSGSRSVNTVNPLNYIVVSGGPICTQHKFTEYYSDNNATCIEDGTKTALCNVAGCNATDTIVDVGSKLGHSFTNYVSDGNATDTDDGTKTAVCDRAGCDVTDTIPDTGSRLGHSFTHYVSNNDATCLSDGTKTAVCETEGCNETDTILDEGSRLGHSFTHYVPNGDATCIEDGTMTAVCDRDGCNETDTIVDKNSALGHSESEWIVEKEAKVGEEGMRHIECTVCKEILTTEPIEALPYAITKGDESILDDISSALIITANGDIDKFVKLVIDDVVVDPSNYDLVSGSTIATLKAKFLETLSAGKHTITFVYTDGQTSGTFEIKEKPIEPKEVNEDEKVVNTSDDSRAGLWVVLAIVNGSFAVLMKKYK